MSIGKQFKDKIIKIYSDKNYSVKFFLELCDFISKESSIVSKESIYEEILTIHKNSKK